MNNSRKPKQPPCLRCSIYEICDRICPDLARLIPPDIGKISKVVGGISIKQKIFQLRCKGLSWNEIAKETGREKSTVRTIYRRFQEKVFERFPKKR